MIFARYARHVPKTPCIMKGGVSMLQDFAFDFSNFIEAENAALNLN